MPTVCGMCAVGCNTNATVREGKVKRILSRNHPEIDEGWICDKGRFGFTHLRSADRIVDPIRRVRRRGFEPVSWDEALDEAERLLRGAEGRIVTALSGSETVEQAYALAKLLRRGLGSHQAMLPEPVLDALDAYRLPLSAIRDAAGRRRARRRPGRGARADRRAVDQGGAAERRAGALRAGRGRRARGRARRADLVRARRRRRRARRRARRAARPRVQGRLRRLLPARDAERPRDRGRVGGGLRRGGPGRGRRSAC